MSTANQRLFRATLCGLFVSAAVGLAACHDTGVGGSVDDGGGNPSADLSGPDLPASSGDDMRLGGSGDMRGAPADMRGAPADMSMPGPPENNPLLNGITAEHNNARAAVNPVPTTPLPAMTWNTTVASVAQGWANNCMFNS